jgi:hypothetical protein
MGNRERTPLVHLLLCRLRHMRYRVRREVPVGGFGQAAR